MFKMWIEILALAFLGICAVCDGLEQKIPLAVVWLGIITALVLRARGLSGDGTWQSAAAALMPGSMFWLLSYISGEKVGYGDGWMLIMIGLFVGLWKCFLVMMTGLIAESVVLLILLAFRKASGNDRVPFAPFLLLGLGAAVCL